MGHWLARFPPTDNHSALHGMVHRAALSGQCHNSWELGDVLVTEGAFRTHLKFQTWMLLQYMIGNRNKSLLLIHWVTQGSLSTLNVVWLFPRLSQAQNFASRELLFKSDAFKYKLEAPKLILMFLEQIEDFRILKVSYPWITDLGSGSQILWLKCAIFENILRNSDSKQNPIEGVKI